MDHRTVRSKRGKRHVEGDVSGPTQARDYQELVERFRRSGHYTGFGEPRARNGDKPRTDPASPMLTGLSDHDHSNYPHRQDLPIPGYDRLSLAQVVKSLDMLPRPRIEAMRDYEQSHANRKAWVEEFDRRLVSEVNPLSKRR